MKVVVPNSLQGGGDGERHAWPPGFRFHPTDEELVLYYLKRKICRKRLKLDIIAETDVYKWDPEDLPGQSKIRSGDRQWFFFSPRDRKYPNAARSNRATQHGYWKATGKDRNIVCNSRTVGVKKTLVFYKGRAPTGERTDWVMHEYTLDEEELKRCQTAGDYYALYKVFKKSGPGPKNGEQYGAPFKEEDWADDEFGDMNNFIVHQENPVIHCKPIVSQTPILAVSQVNNEVPLVDLPIKEANFNERSIVLHPNSQQYGMEEASFDFTKSTTPISQFFEIHEITSAPDINEQNIGIDEEDFLELNDILELDDLLGQEPTGVNVQTSMGNLQVDELDGFSEFLHGQEPTGVNVQTSGGNLQLHELDGFSELDLPNMFVREMGHIGQGTISNTYLNNFENPMVNQINYQLPFSADDVDQINSELWTNDLTNTVLTQSELNPGVLSLPNPGVVNENNATNIPTETYPKQSGPENDNDQNWFTSALWAFVESIPTTPASATENALVNRAFERISSFSRVSVSATTTNITAKKASKNRVFFLCSIMVLLFAIFWVLVKGDNGFIVGRYISHNESNI